MREAYFLLLMFTIAFQVTPLSATATSPVSRPGCPDKCGNVSIPYPFGIGADCAAASINSYFIVTCNDTFKPPRPMIGDHVVSTEVIDISLERSEMRVYAPVSYNCYTSATEYTTNPSDYEYHLVETPFILSPTRNRLTVIGCNTLGLIGGYKQDKPGDTISSSIRRNPNKYVTGCYSYCQSINSMSDGEPCTGMGCCQITITQNLTELATQFGTNQSSVWDFNPCFYAMVAEEGWYNFSRQDLRDRNFIDGRAKRGVPAVVDWAIRNTSCPTDKAHSLCVSSNSTCVNKNDSPGYICKCSKGYDGNPYLQDGCQDIHECDLRKQNPDTYEKLYPCKNGICEDIQGSYNCKCGMVQRSDSHNSECLPLLTEAEQVIIGVSVFTLMVTALACLSAMKFQRKKHRKEKDEYFKQNGGLKLYDEMRSRQVDTIHILTEKEVKKATDNYSEDRVLGCGGRGMVYRGTLDDGKEVAIKKSKVIDDDCREEFVNEIIILSQINHRNIVRLLGCCLEVDVPMLVYEFISNGTLFEFLHGNDRRSLIPLDLRLKIATQSAEALAYIHSSTSRIILHGDVKSLNILLDDENNAKVADFGASSLKSLDENDFIMLIQGTFGYLDPETLVSHQLTEKSDVYSFGVVLLELLTRKRAMYTDDFNEKKALSHTFILMFSQKKLYNIFDYQIIEDEAQIVLEKLAELIMHCLSPRGDERPTMKEVAERLQMLRRIQMQRVIKPNLVRMDDPGGDASVPIHSDQLKYQGTDTVRMVLDVDLSR